MISLAKSMGNLTVGLQSLAVAGEGLKLIPKDFGINGKYKKSKPIKQNKKIIKGFVNIYTGMALIKPTADIVASL